MAKRLVISDMDLLKGAEAIAADMRGPDERRLKLAKMIDVHLGWFELARRRGLEWNDIVALLFRAGATRSDGRPLSRGHLQSLVWRKQRAERHTTESGPVHGDVSPAITKRTARLPAPGEHSELVRERKRQPAKQANAAPAAALPERPAVAGKPGARPEGNALLAYMKRAARLRRDD